MKRAISTLLVFWEYSFIWNIRVCNFVKLFAPMCMSCLVGDCQEKRCGGGLTFSTCLHLCIGISNVTLVVEMKDKDFTSHKAKYVLQFGTNIFMVWLSLTFKSIKQKIQFSQHSELISFLMFWKVILYSHQYWVSCSWKKGFSHKKTDPWGVRSHMSKSEEWFLVKIVSFCLNLKVFPPCRCSKWFKTTHRSF